MLKINFVDLVNESSEVVDLVKDYYNCVYKFQFSDGRVYIGSTEVLRNRLFNPLFGHVTRFKSKYSEFYKAIDADTTFEILYTNVDENLGELEEDLILKYNSVLNGYNNLGAVSIREGNRWVKKGDVCILVPCRLLDDYLKQGWEEGSIYFTNTGYNWCTNDADNLMIKEGESIPDGYHFGRTHDVNLNKIGINKDGTCMFVAEDELEQKLSEGWVVGNGSSTNKNTTWMNDGKRSIRVPKGEEEIYALDGWVIGNLGSTNKGKLWFCNGFDNMMIDIEKNEVPKGYYRGKLGTQGLTVPGMTYITDGYEVKFIKESELINYPDWVNAYIHYVKVTKNGETYDIYPRELPQYLSEGWTIKMTSSQRKLHKNENLIVVDKYYLQKFLDKGWLQK